MGAGVCALLLLLLVNGLVQCNDRRRRDVHRIIIREQVARGPGQHHHYHSRGPARGHSSDGRKRGLHDSHEYSDEFERRPAESSKKYKKLPPQSDSLEESSQVFANDWKPLLNGNKANYYYPLVRSAARPSKSTPHSVAPVKEIKDGASNRLKPTPKPLPIHEAVDITTVFPPKKASLSPSVYKNNLKRINHMNYFNYKLMQTGGDSNTPAESKLKENFDLPRRRPVKKQVQPKKVDGGYQVHEDVEGDTKPPKYTSFNALSPSLMKSVPLYPAFEDNQIIDRAKENKTVTANVGTFGKRTKPRRNNKSSSQ